MKLLLQCLSLSVLLSATTNAAVVINLAGSPTSGPVFTITGGGLIPDGSLVKVGVLTETPAAGATFAQLAAIFQEFGRTTSGTDTSSGNNTGRIQRAGINGSATADSPQPDSFFATKQVYIWVYGDSAGGASSPQGLYSSNTIFEDKATAVSVSMGSFATAYGTFGDGGLAAGFTPGATQGTASAYRLAAVAVPEPSAVIFGLLSLGLIARRKR